MVRVLQKNVSVLCSLVMQSRVRVRVKVRVLLTKVWVLLTKVRVLLTKVRVLRTISPFFGSFLMSFSPWKLERENGNFFYNFVMQNGRFSA